MTEAAATRAVIHLDAVRANFAEAERHAPGRRVIAVVKADAYGHGMVAVGAALESSVDLFGVASVEEGARLRAAGCRKPLMLLGAVVPDFFPALVEHDLQAMVSSVDEARGLSEAAVAAGDGKMVEMHLMLDTGMGRIGFLDEGSLGRLSELDQIDIVGVASHYPSADEDADYTSGQLARFLKRVGGAGLAPRWVHIANSAGVLGFPSEATNLVRAGLMIYGSSPLTEHQEKLRPALTWKSRIALLRDLPPGHSISYGRTFVTGREPFTRVATVSVGYGDGYPRALSGKGTGVLVRGQRCPVLGRVTMDQIMVDVSELGDVVVPGDEVVLIGDQGRESILAAELAERAGTIAWEIFTGITQRASRVYVH